MSSHREAPEISKDPVADSTDVYAFVSPDKPGTVTLIANYIPLEGPAGTAAANAGEPLVVYLSDTSSGEFEVFNGTSQVRVHNPRLVAQLLDGLQTAQ